MLGTQIMDGYIPTRRSVIENGGKWYRDMKKSSRDLAHPRNGRDRQAIALACFRDFVYSEDDTVKWENLEETRRQLEDLYNTVTPNPFEL